MLPHQEIRCLDNSDDMIDKTSINLKFPEDMKYLKLVEVLKWNCLVEFWPPEKMSQIQTRDCLRGTVGVTTVRRPPITIEWTKIFTWPVGSTPRAFSEGSSYCTISKPTRKVGCMARLKFRKIFPLTQYWSYFQPTFGSQCYWPWNLDLVKDKFSNE